MLIWYEFFYENNMLFNIFSVNFQLLRFLILILFLFKDIIQLLLRHGANMGVKNWEEQPPVNRILPATLQEFSFFRFKIVNYFSCLKKQEPASYPPRIQLFLIQH